MGETVGQYCSLAGFLALSGVLRCYLFSRNYKAAFSTMKTALMYVTAPALKLYVSLKQAQYCILVYSLSFSLHSWRQLFLPINRSLDQGLVECYSNLVSFVFFKAKICLEESIKQDPTFEKSAISLSIIYRQERNPMAGIGV